MMNRKHMIDWIFFDLGSTLLDETDRVEEKINNTAELLQIDSKTFHAQIEQAAKTHPYVVKMDLPNNAEWTPWPKRLDPLYSHAIPVLTELHKRYKLGVIANHGKYTAQLLGIDHFFNVYTASGALGFGKPDLRIFEMALSQAKCKPENSIMIGDRLDNDIYPAKKLGMKTMWIRQGYGGMCEPMSEEYMPDYTVYTLPEILTIL
jgi:haloacid dehalogenase superfamily, subfamily IA, variant 3 with third motif having DD or ED/haloacid dehalogenase superfamily, subfamily IA, variant 1 with third motif having Dx(3-4)D or Dx(3-4)E